MLISAIRYPPSAVRCLLSAICMLSAACCLLVVAGCGGGPKDTIAEVETGAPGPGKANARIRVTPGEVKVSGSYTVTYEFENATKVRYQLLRIETNQGVLLRTNPGWRQNVAQPGQTVKVAEVTSQAVKPGTIVLTAAFITDRGTFDAQSVPVLVTGPVAAVNSARAWGSILIQPNPVTPGQQATVTYSFTDSTGEDCEVTGIATDSLYPIRGDNPAWLGGHVSNNSSKVIAQTRLVKNEPGSYEFRARFLTRTSAYTAPPVALVVSQPTAKDTGHVSAQIAISPNPCPVGSDYRIEYQIINTTLKDVTVSNISTDIGVLAPGSAEWLTGAARAGGTTTIARVTGTGEVISSRTKTASFETSAGMFIPPPTVFVVQ